MRVTRGFGLVGLTLIVAVALLAHDPSDDTRAVQPTDAAFPQLQSLAGVKPGKYGRTYIAAVLEGTADHEVRELPVRRIPNIGSSAEFYFGPDSYTIIGNAKREGDSAYHVYVTNLEGSPVRRINDQGEDACSFIFPDGTRLIWTSTRDHSELPKGNFSDPKKYPQGAELYTSGLDGSGLKRLTNNSNYEAEVSVSPDGRWVLFGRQIKGKMELWRMRPDGGGEVQITHLEGWQPGGAQYLPDSRTILFRAWRVEDEGKAGGMPMSIFTISHDGTGLRRVTTDAGTNWAPYPAPDGPISLSCESFRRGTMRSTWEICCPTNRSASPTAMLSTGSRQFLPMVIGCSSHRAVTRRPKRAAFPST